MKIEHSDEGVHSNDQILDGRHTQDKELKLFAIGACVILSTNLWTETGLVNGAYGVVKSILKPVTDSNAHVFMVDFPNHRGLSLVPYVPTVIPIRRYAANILLVFHFLCRGPSQFKNHNGSRHR